MTDPTLAVRLFDEARASRLKTADLRARFILLVDVFQALSETHNRARARHSGYESPVPGREHPGK
ncbi:hypothetical protein [Amycolatopsis sp. lyj-112]|uniref:hypothetical protein n=1 Tax=Amycolatopsis sp. lyj-112 TaxID=2789288 RepID=UPI00397CAAEC